MSKKILSVISILIITFSFLFVTACNGMNDDNKGKVDTPKTPPVSSQDTTPVFYDYAAPDFNRVIDGMTLTFFDEFDGTELMKGKAGTAKMELFKDTVILMCLSMMVC